MGRQQIMDKLHELRLPAMATAYERLSQGVDDEGLTFDEQLGFLVDAEYLSRQNRKLARLLQEAKLRIPATPEDINYRQARGLDRGVTRTLLEGGVVGEKAKHYSDWPHWCRQNLSHLRIGICGMPTRISSSLHAGLSFAGRTYDIAR